MPFYRDFFIMHVKAFTAHQLMNTMSFQMVSLYFASIAFFHPSNDNHNAISQGKIFVAHVKSFTTHQLMITISFHRVTHYPAPRGFFSSAFSKHNAISLGKIFIMHRVSLYFINKLFNISIFFDFSKAFDTIHHVVLWIKRLHG